MTDSKKTKSFSSDMTGAAVLSGTAGALIAVLDSVLVNGFGSVSLTGLAVASSVATATVSSGHSFKVGSVALVAGATPSGLNGEKRVLSTASNSFTFDATGISDGAATGTMTAKVAAAGWTKQFTGTNIAVYKMGGVEGTGFVLRVDDSGTTVARVRGYEVMTDANTGTGLFPTTVQWADSGLWWTKSNAASAASRPWRIVADTRGFFYFCKNADTSSEHQGNYFGDVLSLKSNDPYACVLRANAASRAANTTAIQDSFEVLDALQSYDGMYIARAANTLGGATKLYQSAVTSVGLPLSHTTGAVGWPYPSPVDNGLMLTPIALYAASTGYRGYFPGISVSPQITNTAFSTGDVIAGSGEMAGRSVTVVKMGAPAAGGTQGVVFMDQTSDWR